jgi:hypothetical protein
LHVRVGIWITLLTTNLLTDVHSTFQQISPKNAFMLSVVNWLPVPQAELRIMDFIHPILSGSLVASYGFNMQQLRFLYI